MTVTDTLGRPITDLRVSVTDRCNFRCGFCMPADRTYRFLPRPDILTFEEVARLAKVFVGLGVRKVRLTGGEPLLRMEIEQLVAQLAGIDGIEDLALTTNAYRLADHATLLFEAGLQRVTVSLHSLDDATFGRLNGLGMPLSRVLDGLAAARAAGLAPIKLNVVVMKGVNDHELLDLARFARDEGYLVRFIEYMDVGTVNRWDPEMVVSAREIVDRLNARWPLVGVDRDHAGDVAARYRYVDGAGEVGVITSITQPFCGDCSRVRLSADGALYTCLFSPVGHNLKTPLRSGATDAELASTITEIWRRREDRYSETRTNALRAGRFVPTEKVEMYRIGG